MRRGDWLFCLLLFVFTLVSRAVTSGPPYFADAPSHLACIAARTFVIQPPGYWLFNRFCGLFPAPEHAFHMSDEEYEALLRELRTESRKWRMAI